MKIIIGNSLVFLVSIDLNKLRFRMKFAGEMLTRNMESIQLIMLLVIAIVSQSDQQIQFPQDQKPFNATAVAEKRVNRNC